MKLKWNETNWIRKRNMYLKFYRCQDRYQLWSSLVRRWLPCDDLWVYFFPPKIQTELLFANSRKDLVHRTEFIEKRRWHCLHCYPCIYYLDHHHHHRNLEFLIKFLEFLTMIPCGDCIGAVVRFNERKCASATLHLIDGVWILHSSVSPQQCL